MWISRAALLARYARRRNGTVAEHNNRVDPECLV